MVDWCLQTPSEVSGDQTGKCSSRPLRPPFSLPKKPSCATLFVLVGLKISISKSLLCLWFFRRDKRLVRQEYNVPILALRTSGSWLIFQKSNKTKFPPPVIVSTMLPSSP